MRNSSSAATAAVTGLAVAAGAATTVVAVGSRPSPRQLSDRGWTCFLPPAPGEVVPTPSMPHRAIALTTMPKGKVAASRDFEDGSDGTRTRDLRRDRPSRAPRRPATNASEQPHLQGFSALEAGRYRMVEPIVHPTFGPRVGHEILSSWTTQRLANERDRLREDSHRVLLSVTSAVFRSCGRARAGSSSTGRLARHAGAGGACLSSRRRPSRINPAVPSAA
jgi:hypothetical protein